MSSELTRAVQGVVGTALKLAKRRHFQGVSRPDYGDIGFRLKLTADAIRADAITYEWLNGMPMADVATRYELPLPRVEKIIRARTQPRRRR